MQSATWFRKAAEQGKADAQFSLSKLYYSGQGVQQDYGQVVEWSRKAAEQGFALAQYNLGVLYDIGQGVPQNYAEAYFWLDMAAAHMQGKSQESAAKLRDEVAAKLSPADLSTAQQRAAQWFASHPAQP